MTTPPMTPISTPGLSQQAAALRAKESKPWTGTHLAEEISDSGRSIENAIESHLERLLLHLLKYRYDPGPALPSRLAPDYPACPPRARQTDPEKSWSAAPSRALSGRSLSPRPRRCA